MKTDPTGHEENLKKAERIAALIAAHLKGTITGEEADELDNWITESDENLELFENLTDEDNIEHAMQQYLQAEKKKGSAFDELRGTIQQGKRNRRLLPWPLVVAASVLIVAGGIYLLSYNNPHTSNEKPVAYKAEQGDVQAGSDKAVLTLSDGRTVILDSSRPGVIANDGAVSIQQSQSGLIVYSGTGAAMVYNTVSTPRAGQYRMVLGDGTKVWMNAESVLRFPADMNASPREVELNGEAYFEVASNPAKPFRVRLLVDGAEKATVEVLGTHFNANAYGGEEAVSTTLLEGSVKVEKGTASSVLLPGQQAIIGNNIQVRRVEAAEAVAWKEGKFLFRDATIQAIADQIKRWYDVEVETAGPVSQYFNMEISRQVPLSKLLAGLEKTGQVRFTLTGRKLLIRP